MKNTVGNTDERDQRRQHLEPAAGTDAGDARDGAPLAGPAILVAVVDAPRVLAAHVAVTVAPEVDAPHLFGPIGEAQAGPGDGHLDLPAFLGDAAGEEVLEVLLGPDVWALALRQEVEDAIADRIAAAVACATDSAMSIGPVAPPHK